MKQGVAGKSPQESDEGNKGNTLFPIPGFTFSAFSR